MNRVIIELGPKRQHIEYFINGEVPVVGDVLYIENEELVEVWKRKFSFEDRRVENGKIIRKPTIRLIVKDLY